MSDKGQRNTSRHRSNPRTTEEHVDASRQSNLALQKAFKSVSKKYNKLQEDYEAVYQENIKAQTDKAALIRENEMLKLNLEKGFKAFDDKFKETEQLRKELDQKQKENAESRSNEKTDGISAAHVENSKTYVAICQSTQTEEEITEEETTDETFTSYVALKDVLEECGLEIIMQDKRAFLLLIDRDRLKLWLENTTDGKVSVDFDQTQTKKIDKKEEDYEEENENENESLIIMLKNKVAQQADAISRYHAMLSTMEHIKSTTSNQPETNKPILKSRSKSSEKYHQNLHGLLQEVLSRMNVLKQHIDFQQQYIKNLNDVVKRSKNVPKHWKLLSAQVAQAGNPTEKQHEREVKKPPKLPVKAENIDEEAVEEEDVPEEDQSPEDGLFSLAVQETDKYPSYVLKKSGDNSASIITIGELSRIPGVSQSKPSISQAKSLPKLAPATQNSEWVATQPKVKSEKSEAAGTSRERNIEEQQDDDIEIINEEEAAVGGARRKNSGTKQCPLCFIAFSPSSSQSEFENHVVAHFQD